MASLGSFGVVHEPTTPNAEPDTFEYFGAIIRIVNDPDDIDMIDFLESARTIDDQGLMALTAVKDGLRILIDPRDFDLFWLTAKQNRQTVEDLSKLFSDLVTGETDRPTQQPSDFSNGRLETVESSTAVSFSPPVTSGRPDLQIIHEDGAESLRRIAAAAAAG